MLFLPNSNGRFPVGITTFATPVRPARPIGSVKLKNVQGQDNALYLEEVVFSAYYPADVDDASSKKGVPWLPRPIREILCGFAIFLSADLPSWLLWPLTYFFAIWLKIPAYPNAPLLNPAKARTFLKHGATPLASQWQMVIFSHGLGGTRTAYSQFCTRLAASGRVVIALEHRDGTAPVCLPRSWDADEEIRRMKRTLFYLRETDIITDDNDIPAINPLAFRAEQLTFRHHEIHIAYSAICRFLENDLKLEMEIIDKTFFDKQSWTALNQSGEPVIKYDCAILAGHSFGGCTMLSLLSVEPLEGYHAIPVERAIILDPWLEPLPSPGPIPFSLGSSSEIEQSEKLASSSMNATEVSSGNNSEKTKLGNPSMLVINSETFTLWKDHYARLREVVARWEPQGGRIMTIVGSVHISFSDFGVLPIFRRRYALSVLDVISRLSLSFLDDRLDETLREIPKVDMGYEVIGVKKDGKPKRKLVGKPGDIVVE